MEKQDIFNLVSVISFIGIAVKYVTDHLLRKSLVKYKSVLAVEQKLSIEKGVYISNQLIESVDNVWVLTNEIYTHISKGVNVNKNQYNDNKVLILEKIDTMDAYIRSHRPYLDGKLVVSLDVFLEYCHEGVSNNDVNRDEVVKCYDKIISIIQKIYKI